MTETRHCLYRPEFPRANGYDPGWIMDNQMGPNALWLAEWLADALGLEPEMRVLDLGCGTAMTSIFLAREFGVRVWAADLWVGADENWRRAREAGEGDRVYPMRVEAHALPFPEGFFDAIVSVDSYQYFGTDALYLGYLTRFARPRAAIGVVVPGLLRSLEGGVPAHLTRPQANGVPFWEDECACFLTVERWKELWERPNRVTGIAADVLPDGWKLWRDFEIELERAGKNRFPSVAEALEADRGRYLGFIRLVARRAEGGAGTNLYDPGLIASMSEGGG